MADYNPPYRTGRSRFRSKFRLFGRPLMVLQIEWKTDAHTREFIDECGHPDPRYYAAVYEWKDATLEDVDVKVVS